MSKLVYSTDPEPPPEKPAPAPAKPPRQQTAVVSRDRKRRRGKTVTVIAGLQHNPDTLRELLKTLQKAVGAGGTVKDGEIEIQGDHRERVGEKLVDLGYKVKYSGG